MNLEGVVQCDYSAEKISAGIDVVSFLGETNIFPSKGEARKLVQNGGISINRKKVEQAQLTIDRSLLLYIKNICWCRKESVIIIWYKLFENKKRRIKDNKRVTVQDAS